MNIERIGVVGAGTMGGGIAQAAAASGYEVILEDIKEEYVRAGLGKIEQRLERMVDKRRLVSTEKEKILSNIRTTTSLDDLRDTQFIIEAVVEKEEIKKEIFTRLDEICPEGTIFTSNTSSISITRLAMATKRPGRFAGMHFMNPAYIMKLVEVVRGSGTSGETLDTVTKIAEKMGKIPVIVNDSPGFISNRILMPMINDAIYCLQEGVASKEGIDSIMKLGANHPMGPLELADFIGLDICLAILEVLYTELGEKYKPCPLLSRMVAAGKLGRKSGEGLFEYGK